MIALATFMLRGSSSTMRTHFRATVWLSAGIIEDLPSLRPSAVRIIGYKVGIGSVFKRLMFDGRVTLRFSQRLLTFIILCLTRYVHVFIYNDLYYQFSYS